MLVRHQAPIAICVHVSTNTELKEKERKIKINKISQGKKTFAKETTLKITEK